MTTNRFYTRNITGHPVNKLVSLGDNIDAGTFPQWAYDPPIDESSRCIWPLQPTDGMLPWQIKREWEGLIDLFERYIFNSHGLDLDNRQIVSKWQWAATLTDLHDWWKNKEKPKKWVGIALECTEETLLVCFGLWAASLDHTLGYKESWCKKMIEAAEANCELPYLTCKRRAELALVGQQYLDTLNGKKKRK